MCTGGEYMNRIYVIGLIALVVLLAMPVMAATLVDDEQSDFSGIYTSTYYDPSGFLRLDQPIVIPPSELIGNEAGLTAYWRFNEPSWSGTAGEVKDVLGINHGTAKGGATTTTGKFGNAGSFSGTGYIALPSGVSSSLGGKSGATVTAWVKRNTPSARNTIIDLTIAGGSSKLFFDYQADNTLRCGGRSVTLDGAQYKVTTGTFTDTNWHFVACGLDLPAKDVKIYVDGIQQPTAAKTLTFGATTFAPDVGPNNFIGAQAASSIYQFNGVMDEFALWNKVLTSSEILALYQKGSSGKIVTYEGAYVSDIKDAGLPVQWKDISWMSSAIGELPDNKAPETTFAYGNADMAGNILLLHMNEQSGTILDSSGSVNNGAATGITYNAEGKMGSGLGFNGASSYVNLGPNSIAPELSGKSGATLSAWIKPNSLQNNGPDYRNNIADFLIKSDDGTGTYYSAIYLTLRKGGQIWCGGRSTPSDPFQSIETGPIVSAGKWQQVACSLDFTNKKVSVYYNGQKTGSATSTFASNVFVPGDLSSSIGRDIIGVTPQISSYYFNGVMDELGLWNRPLSDDEVVNLYGRGMPLDLSVRSCDDTICEGESYLDASDASPQDLALPNNRYFQYRFGFSTDSVSYSPRLYDVSTNYQEPVVDITPPVIALVSPENNLITANSAPGFVFIPTDDIASSMSCTLTMDNGAVQSYGPTTAASGVETTITPSPALATGVYSWWIDCSDGTNSGISDERHITIETIPDEGQVLTLIGTASEIGTKWGRENRQSILQQYNNFLVGRDQANLRLFAQRFIDISTDIDSSHWVIEANATADEIGADRELFIAFIAGRYRGLADHYPPECTSFFVKPPATKDGQIIFHKTRDNSEELQAAYIKHTTGLPPGHEVYKFFAEMGTADTGISYFVNEKGLAGSADMGGAATAKYDGLMNHFTARYIAEHCKDVYEAHDTLHWLVEEKGYSAGATIVTNWLFLDKNGNALHIADDGYHIITEELNPVLNHDGTDYDGIYFTIRRSNAEGSPEDALVANYGNINVTLVDGTQVAKHSAMSFRGSSLSGATFLIDPDYPSILTSIFISIPAWGYSVPVQLGVDATPKALMNGTVYAYQKSHLEGQSLDPAFESSIYSEWESFYNDIKPKVPSQDVTTAMNDKFLYFVNRILNPGTTEPPTTELKATLVDVTQDGTFVHLDIADSEPYNSLKVYLPFDTDTSKIMTYDYSSSHNDGTYRAKAFTNMDDGRYGGALQLTAVDGSYVGLQGQDTVGGASAATMSVWANANNIGKRRAIFDETWEGSSYSRLFLEYQADNRVRCGGRSQLSDTTFQSVSTSLPVATGTWTHIACVMNVPTDSIDIYINGEKVPTTGTPSFSLPAFASTIPEFQGLGKSAVMPDTNYDGLIDEFMVFNSALTAEQIASIYNNQFARFKNTGTLNFDPIDVTLGNSIVDVTNNVQNLMGTQLKLKVGYYDGSWHYTDDQPVTELNTFPISDTSTQITLNYTLISDVYQFYTPVFLSNSVTIEPVSEPTITIEFPNEVAVKFGKMSNSAPSTGSLTVKVTMDGGDSWYINAVDEKTANTGYLVRGSIPLAYPLELSNDGGESYSPMTSGFMNFMTGSGSGITTQTADFRQIIAASDPSGDYTMNVTFRIGAA